jgi:hypothetical protein
MHEPGVALTDYALAIENAIFAFVLSRVAGPNAKLRLWFVVFFSAIALAALLGGISHGFAPSLWIMDRELTWTATMITIGLAGLGAWMSAAHLRGCERARSGERIAGWGVFAAFVFVVLFVSQDFKYAIVAYLPATLFLLLSFFGWWIRSRHESARIGALGVLLTFVAAGVQQSELSLHSVYMNNNVIYHIIQAIALALVFVGARAAVSKTD